MAINIPSKLVKIDKILIKQDLYTPATYKEVIPASNPEYDPISGTYLTDNGTIDHSFNVVLLDTDYNSLEDNMYNVTAQIMILPQNITFEPDMDQVYTIKGRDWHVAAIKLAPVDSLWEITVGRK
jgi:hypothetical protein|tara:strand:- start:14090 stop:14464 length:375 start_codon:yes stop_codon:yes gene_type:complete